MEICFELLKNVCIFTEKKTKENGTSGNFDASKI